MLLSFYQHNNNLILQLQKLFRKYFIIDRFGIRRLMIQNDKGYINFNKTFIETIFSSEVEYL